MDVVKRPSIFFYFFILFPDLPRFRTFPYLFFVLIDFFYDLCTPFQIQTEENLGIDDVYKTYENKLCLHKLYRYKNIK